MSITGIISNVTAVTRRPVKYEFPHCKIKNMLLNFRWEEKTMLYSAIMKWGRTSQGMQQGRQLEGTRGE